VLYKGSPDPIPLYLPILLTHPNQPAGSGRFDSKLASQAYGRPRFAAQLIRSKSTGLNYQIMKR